MTLIRSLAFNLLFYLYTAILLVAGLPCLVAERRATLGLARFWGRGSLALLEAVCGTKVEFRGLDRLPPGGCIIAAKHQSALETFALCTVVTDFSYILKRELMLIPLFGWYMKRAELVGIDRGRRSHALTRVGREARRVIADGRRLVIFPEGTRRPVGAAPDYKSGVAHIYAESAAPCVPVALNTGLFWPRRSLLRRPGRVVIEFLEAIPPGLDRRGFMATLQARTEAATDRLVREAQGADPTQPATLTPTKAAPVSG
jgi:1-acyl-sn-glycerol-3-phosphate acyltransferase